MQALTVDQVRMFLRPHWPLHTVSAGGCGRDRDASGPLSLIDPDCQSQSMSVVSFYEKVIKVKADVGGPPLCLTSATFPQKSLR